MSKQKDYNSGYGGYQQGNATTSINQFENAGHPGYWAHAKTVAVSTTVSFTGSFAGASGIIFSPKVGSTATVSLTDGGSFSVGDFGPASGSIYELSVKNVTNPAGGPIIVLYRNKPAETALIP